MTVSALLTLIQIMAGMGSIASSIVNVRKDLEKRNPTDPAPPEHIATVKAAMGSSGSVWDEDHAGE